MKITFLGTLDSNGGNGNDAKYGSCSEFGVIYADSGTDVNIGATITPMTAAEFVGHIDDIGSEYDMEKKCKQPDYGKWRVQICSCR